ncbi:unnamed protein product, partial [Discosporangium mesarthrocarpum]
MFCRFRTPDSCFEPYIRLLALSSDRQVSMAPGEPVLWETLSERVTRGELPKLILHIGGQVWMANAFEEAWAMLREHMRASWLCGSRNGEGWGEVQSDAEERMREAVRRAWNLPWKRTLLASVPNLMLCGEDDVHPQLGGALAELS